MIASLCFLGPYSNLYVFGNCIFSWTKTLDLSVAPFVCPSAIVHYTIVMRRSNRNFNTPLPRENPGHFDYLLCPGSGEFDLCLRWVGKIEPEVSGFK